MNKETNKKLLAKNVGELVRISHELKNNNDIAHIITTDGCIAIGGKNRDILCEFSAIVASLCSVGFSKEKIMRGVEVGIEAYKEEFNE